MQLQPCAAAAAPRMLYNDHPRKFRTRPGPLDDTGPP